MLTKEVEKQLISKAFEMKLKAYCPYSKYHVGAALLSKSGKIYGGHNIENSSYGATICAERCAVFKTVSEGEREFVAIAICGGLEGSKPKGDDTDNAFPCGICSPLPPFPFPPLPAFLPPKPSAAGECCQWPRRALRERHPLAKTSFPSMTKNCCPPKAKGAHRA